jgi:hypothetical protein
MIWLSVKRDFFTGISSAQITRKFHFWPQLISGGITVVPLLVAMLAAVVWLTAREGRSQARAASP